jgi:hypothetical protein
LRPFQGYFTAAIWRHALVLVAGAVLAPGRRTVTAALRVMGLGQAAGFAVHHRVLSVAVSMNVGPAVLANSGPPAASDRPVVLLIPYSLMALRCAVVRRNR